MLHELRSAKIVLFKLSYFHISNTLAAGKGNNQTTFIVIVTKLRVLFFSGV